MTLRGHIRGIGLPQVAGLALIFALCLTNAPGPANAQGKQPLPALPAQAVLDKVISETGGAKQTLIGIPKVISNQFLSMALMLNPMLTQGTDNLSADKIFDVAHAVYYFGLDKMLKLVLVPMANSETIILGPNMTTSDGMPAQMIGVGYDFSSGPMVLLVVWKDAKAQKPSELRVYTITNAQLQFTTPYKLNIRKLKGDKVGKVAPWDKGVIIAARETCFSFTKDQICYSPSKQDKRADAKAGAQIDDALKALMKTYDVKAKIDVDGALPEIAGVAARKACSAKLAAATGTPAMVNIPECAANMAFAGVTDNPPSAVIGAIWLATDIEQPAYDLQGNSMGKITAGTYLMVDATPSVIDVGMPGVLMLVNADGKTNFLIPSQVVEGFGDSDDKGSNGNKGQAGIKDATVGAHGF